MGARTVRSRFSYLIAGFALAISVLASGPAMAWGAYGHRATAAIALANVKPSTRAAIARLIAADGQLGTPDCRIRNLEDAATWADCIRRDGWRWGYSFAWHYRTAPICEAYDPKKNCSGGNCILAQIDRNQRILADESLPSNVRIEALAFLVHFIGDVHQPLHSGDDDDKGGNDRVTDYGIVPDLNLHSIWDGPLAERAISSAQPSLVRHYSSAERDQLAAGTPADWGRESWQLARDVVYPGAFNRDVCKDEVPEHAALDQEDIHAAIPVVQRRIEQAGLRMARMLDEAFAPGPLPTPERPGGS